MTPDQTKLVKASFSQVVPIADTAATMFYDRLFTIDPSLRGLFAADMTEQKKKLVAMLATAVNNIDRWDEAVLPHVVELGKRHVAYKVKPAHYDSVGQALIETLRAGLGSAFTPDVQDAWIACYTQIAGAMKKSAATLAADA